MRLDPGRLAALLRDAGAGSADDETGPLLTAAREEEARFEAERRQLRRLHRPPDAELPLLPTPSFGRPEVERLADALGELLGAGS
jgi:hypothetical protein